jgi:hypothetical protein
MNDEKLPPIPEELAEEIRAMRRMGPPDDLVDRAFGRLADAKKSPSKKAAIFEPRWPLRRLTLHGFVPALALAGLFVWGFMGRGKGASVPEVVRSEERSVALPEDGHAWTELHLEAHHHADHPAVVHVEVPTHVGVGLPGEPPLERHCVEERCVHKFTHQRNGMPLRIAVAHPGRYEIQVRHESKKASLRERFVLNASRR